MEIEVSKYDKNLAESKREAFAQSGLKEMPAKDSGESIYILAIALVKKRDVFAPCLPYLRYIPTSILMTCICRCMTWTRRLPPNVRGR